MRIGGAEMASWEFGGFATGFQPFVFIDKLAVYLVLNFLKLAT